MQACIISPRDPSLCAPLTVGRKMGDCLVANVPLHSLISTELSRAGFDLVDESNLTPFTVRLPLDHWIEVGALCILARAQEPTCLHDSTGDLVAWVGADTPEECSEKMVTEAQCFKISYPWHLLQLNEEVLEALPASEILGDVSKLSEVNGTLHLGRGSKILPGVVIEGNVVIGKNCKIGPNAYIRGNTSIGDNSIIGNAVEIKNSVLYPHTQVAHLSYVGDSIIGSHTNIGAGTIISNYRHDARNHRCIVNGDLVDTGRQKLGAFIGDGVRTGVHTSVYPGRKIGNGRTTLPGAVIQRDLI